MHDMITRPGYGLLSRDPIYSSARREHALLLKCEGLTYKAIGERLGVSSSRVGQMIWRAEREAPQRLAERSVTAWLG